MTPHTPHTPHSPRKPHASPAVADQGPAQPVSQSQDDASRFHATFAHELANLLDGSLRNVALVMASLRQLEQPDPSEHAAAANREVKTPGTPPSAEMAHRLQTANTAMRQMATMIQQLLASPSGTGTAQAAAASLHAAPDTFTLTQAVDHVLQLLKPIADEQRIALELDIEPDAARLPVGPLFPVIVNAVRNSLQAIGTPDDDACDAPYVVEVKAKITPDQQLQLIIQDNGPGLDPATLDEQGQFRFGTTTRTQGHGLGLPLARDIVQTLGGQLHIAVQQQHASPCAGTTVTVHIPLHRLANFILPTHS